MTTTTHQPSLRGLTHRFLAWPVVGGGATLLLASLLAVAATAQERTSASSAIAFADSLRATLADGNLMQTTDGGATWVERSFGAPGGVKSVAFASPDTGVAVGMTRSQRYATTSYGTRYEIMDAFIVRTTDGGVTWMAVPVPAAVRGLNAVAFADARQGVAVGEAGAMLRTADAGATWQAVRSGTEEFLHGIAFVGPRGWVVGTNVILRTTDAGARWRRDDHRPDGRRNNSLKGVAFADAQYGVVVGGGNFWVTTDGGRHWGGGGPGYLYQEEAARRGIVPSTQAHRATSFDAVAMPSPGTIVAVGFSSGAIARSTDGGATWQLVDSRRRSGATQIAFADARNGLAWGPNGVLRTSDGGATWVNPSGAASREVAVGALTGTWNVSITSVRSDRMTCTGGGTTTMTLAHGDSTLTGTMGGWRLSCRRSYTVQTGTENITRSGSLEGTVPPAPLTGWTDRLRVVRINTSVVGATTRVEAALAGTGQMVGEIHLTSYSSELGSVPVTASWIATRAQ